MTYQEERKIKDRERARKARKYRFDPVPMDCGAYHLSGLTRGSLVIKTQPHGCPKNGTMNQCFIADATTGEFIGMVCQNSLLSEKAWQEIVRDDKHEQSRGAKDISRSEWSSMTDDKRAQAGLY